MSPVGTDVCVVHFTKLYDVISMPLKSPRKKLKYGDLFYFGHFWTLRYVYFIFLNYYIKMILNDTKQIQMQL